MAAFPKLKTSAITQYPATRRATYQNQTVRFLDGTDQRYRDSKGARYAWQISLSELDEGELAAVEEFFLANQGEFGSFAFTDPWDGQVHSDCSFESDELAVQSQAEMRGSTTLTIVKNG
jgi:hypothetical protein